MAAAHVLFKVEFFRNNGKLVKRRYFDFDTIFDGVIFETKDIDYVCVKMVRGDYASTSNTNSDWKNNGFKKGDFGCLNTTVDGVFV